MLRNGAYATVWEVKTNEKYVDLRVQTSRKGKDGKYITDFNGFCRVLGDEAVSMAKTLKEKDRIRVLEIGVTNRYDKVRNMNYWNVLLFGFELVESSITESETREVIGNNEVAEDLPF